MKRRKKNERRDGRHDLYLPPALQNYLDGQIKTTGERATVLICRALAAHWRLEYEPPQVGRPCLSPEKEK